MPGLRFFTIKRMTNKEFRKFIIPDVGLVGGGAPMGRDNIGTRPTDGTKVYDRNVPISLDGYDVGGAYWGKGIPLRVAFTRDMSFVLFYRGYKRSKNISPLEGQQHD